MRPVLETGRSRRGRLEERGGNAKFRCNERLQYRVRTEPRGFDAFPASVNVLPSAAPELAMDTAQQYAAESEEAV